MVEYFLMNIIPQIQRDHNLLLPEDIVILSNRKNIWLNSSLREGFKKKKVQTWDIVPSSATPSPPSELGTSLSEILLTVFFKFVELGLTDQFSSILVPKHFRRFGHSILGFRPPPPCWYNVPSSWLFLKPSLNEIWFIEKFLINVDVILGCPNKV